MSKPSIWEISGPFYGWLVTFWRCLGYLPFVDTVLMAVLLAVLGSNVSDVTVAVLVMEHLE